VGIWEYDLGKLYLYLFTDLKYIGRVDASSRMQALEAYRKRKFFIQGIDYTSVEACDFESYCIITEFLTLKHDKFWHINLVQYHNTISDLLLHKELLQDVSCIENMKRCSFQSFLGLAN